MVHASGEFEDVHRAQGSAIADEAIQRIAQLCAIEKAARGLSPDRRAAAIAHTLIETAKLNDIDPQQWLAETLACMPDKEIKRVDDLLPWKTTP